MSVAGLAAGVAPGAPLGWTAGAAALLLAGVPVRARRRHARGARGRTGGKGRPAARSVGPLAGTSGVVLTVLAVGLACVVMAGPATGSLAALVCAPAAGQGVRLLLARPVARAPDPALPVTLDLAAAALRSGRPLAQALTLAAPAARADTAELLRRVAGLLGLGADPAQAWQAAEPDAGSRAGPLADVARVAVRSATSGAKIALAFVDLAEQLRAEHGAALAVRANRAGITAMAPLAACYLPSFVCLGVVPAVVGIAQATVGVLP